jgi:hypothetical protein
MPLTPTDREGSFNWKQVSLNLSVAEGGGRHAEHAESLVAPLRNSARPVAFIGPKRS